MAALVSFPPEPFFFVNLVHLDGAILVKNKVGHLGIQVCRGNWTRIEHSRKPTAHTAE